MINPTTSGSQVPVNHLGSQGQAEDVAARVKSLLKEASQEGINEGVAEAYARPGVRRVDRNSQLPLMLACSVAEVCREALDKIKTNPEQQSSIIAEAKNQVKIQISSGITNPPQNV